MNNKAVKKVTYPRWVEEPKVKQITEEEPNNVPPTPEVLAF